MQHSLDLTDLPIELRYTIFSYLDAVNLCRVSRVNKEWKSITTSPILWRNLFERDKRNWKCFTSESITSTTSTSISSRATSTIRNVLDFINKLTEEMKIDDEDKSNINWKELYLQQFFENNSTQSSSTPKSALSKLGSLFSKKIHRIPMFGEGMDSSAKQLLYKMMWTKNSPFQMNKLYPGVEGIGSGVGFTIQGVNLNLAAMYKYEDRGIFDKVRPLWKEFFKGASGFIFVLDNSYNPQEAKDELSTFISDEWSSPLLILATGDTSRSPVEIAEQLELNKMPRKWNIRTIDLETLDGIWEGLNWLTSKIQ